MQRRKQYSSINENIALLKALNRLIALVVIAISGAFIFVSCDTQLTINTTDSFLVTGDVANSGEIVDKLDTLELTVIDYNNHKVLASNTLGVIQAYQPIYKDNELNIIANDGFMVTIDVETLNDTYICYSEADGWCFVSDKHPVNSRVKHIKECVLVARKA